MPSGYSGKVLWVNLSAGELAEEPTEQYREWIGGRGLGSYLLSTHQPSGPTTPEQELLLIATGPLVATPLPLATRTAVVTRNLLSGGISYSNVGGDFGIRLKMAGYDAVALSGASPAPVYLVLRNATASILPAEKFWGLQVSELRQQLQEIYEGEPLSFLGIGPAGERQVSIACLIADRAHAAGWGGSGAILGAKRIKAIVAIGDEPVSVHDEARFQAKASEFAWRIHASPPLAGLVRGGTHGLAGAGGYSGLVPTGVRNMQDEYLSPAESSPIKESAFRQWETGRVGCLGCTIRCLHAYDVESTQYGKFSSEGMHANSVRGLASNWGGLDPEDLLMAHTLCNEYGLDVDGVSSAVAFALECAEHGLLPEMHSGDIQLKWGDGRSAVRLVQQIAEGIGLGRVLGRGVAEAAKVIGQGSERLAMMVKNVGINEQGLRSHRAWALGLMTSTRGGGHLGGSPQTENRRIAPEIGRWLFSNPQAGDPQAYEGKGKLVAWTEGLKCVVDSLGLCYFAYGWYDPSLANPEELAELLNLTTGTKMSGRSLHRWGLRCHTMERAFSYLHGGYSRQDDTLPDRFFTEPVSAGPYQGSHLDRDAVGRMLDEYYETLGWDVKTGLPSAEMLRGLDLNFLLPQALR